jgi:hypothetical protein
MENINGEALLTISSFCLAATRMNISASQYLGARLRVMLKTKLIAPGIPSAYSANSPNL